MSSSTYRALLIANSTYPNDLHNLPDLEGPRNDPFLLREALCHSRYGMFSTEDVRLVHERTMAEILRETDEFLHAAHRQDTVLLYYSGHGKLDLSGELYLCARDTRADRLRSTGVKASDLSAMIDESAVGWTVILLDCCHSGAFKGGELAQALAGQGRFIMTSCRTGELANDAHALNRASAFTHHVVEGVVGGALDLEGDGFVGLGDLYGYVHARLVAEGRQIPQRSFAGSGDLPIARRSEVLVSSRNTSDGPGNRVATEPVLELSETLIDLGEVDIDEDLPPERVGVVNRGGGELKWSAECAAKWVTLNRDQYGLLLHLLPGPGTNRANIHVRDDRTGMIKTVRLVVVVRTQRARAAKSTPTNAQPTTPKIPRENVPDQTRAGRRDVVNPFMSVNLPPRLAERFQVLEEIHAQGAEATVLLVDDVELGQRRVLKLYRRGIELDHEASELLMDLSQSDEGSQHIVTLYETGVESGLWFEVQEYCPYQSLRSVMRERTVEPWALATELSNALAYLEGRLYLRDLKPENLLLRTLDPLDVVVGDFGLIRSAQARSVRWTEGGTAAYMPPEAGVNRVTSAWDWWSAGIVLAEVALGRHPLADGDGHVPPALQILDLINRTRVDVSSIADVRLRTLCAGLLESDPERRWRSEQVTAWLGSRADR